MLEALINSFPKEFVSGSDRFQSGLEPIHEGCESQWLLHTVDTAEMRRSVRCPTLTYKTSEKVKNVAINLQQTLTDALIVLPD
jgi:hypothetical protein